MTLDLQLYAKCMELRSKNEIKDNFIFRLGELHIAFAFLKAFGKYISYSGLDEILVDTEIYDPTTLSQIFNGKHMKWGFEAHMILYFLYLIFFTTISRKFTLWHS